MHLWSRYRPIGADIRQRWNKSGYITFALIVRVRNSYAKEYIDNMERRSVEFTNKLYPVAFYVGYHIIMNL